MNQVFQLSYAVPLASKWEKVQGKLFQSIIIKTSIFGKFGITRKI